VARDGIDALAAALEAQARPAIIVLDDLHVLDDARCLRSIDYAIEALPPSVQLVAISRTVPRLRIARLRAQWLLAEIGAAELAFTAAEARRLLDVAEVLGGLDAETLRFLRRTAVLTTLSGDLCDAVTGERGGEARLRERSSSATRGAGRRTTARCSGSCARSTATTTSAALSHADELIAIARDAGALGARAAEVRATLEDAPASATRVEAPSTAELACRRGLARHGARFHPRVGALRRRGARLRQPKSCRLPKHARVDHAAPRHRQTSEKARPPGEYVP
jgi:hypothetical protein